MDEVSDRKIVRKRLSIFISMVAVESNSFDFDLTELFDLEKYFLNILENVCLCDFLKLNLNESEILFINKMKSFLKGIDENQFPLIGDDLICIFDIFNRIEINNIQKSKLRGALARCIFDMIKEKYFKK